MARGKVIFLWWSRLQKVLLILILNSIKVMVVKIIVGKGFAPNYQIICSVSIILTSTSIKHFIA